jgi:VWFA-related protein
VVQSKRRPIPEWRQAFVLGAVLLLLFLQTPAASAQAPTEQPHQKRPRRTLVITQPDANQGASPKTSKSEESAAPDEEVVRVDTDLVNALFTAIDKDKRFVTTLRKEDVRVLENGVPQEIFIFERETDLPLSLAILIDTSTSQELTLPDEKSAARGFVDAVIRPGKDQAAIVSFTGEPTLEQSLTNDPARLRAAIARIEIVPPPEESDSLDASEDPRGWTGIWDAIWATTTEVTSQTTLHTRRAIILLTDGKDTSSTTKRQEAIDLAVKNDTIIYAIGIGDRQEYGISEGALKAVAERTGGRAFFPRDETDLRAAFAQIQSELRSQYLIAYSPSNKARDGSYRGINIEITNPQLRKQKLRLLYRQGYYARQQ